jgi:phosphohistidine phosphatase
MKRLTLMRHAQADNPLPGQPDWDRPLTKRGQLDAKEMTRRLKVQQWRPELILSSPALRTRETATALLKCFGNTQVEYVEELYLADPKPMLAIIQQLGLSTNHLLVVAHNPGIAELADLLCAERSIDTMPTGALVTAEYDLEAWQALRPAMGVNVEFDYPQRPA